MSIHILDTAHIDALVTAGLRLDPTRNLYWLHKGDGQPLDRFLTTETADRVGAMLAAENRLCVAAYWREAVPARPYTFQALNGPINPVIVLRAINGYRYNSNCHTGWLNSEANRFCDALEALAIQKLPGYGTAPGWNIDNRAIFQHHTA